MRMGFVKDTGKPHGRPPSQGLSASRFRQPPQGGADNNGVFNLVYPRQAHERYAFVARRIAEVDKKIAALLSTPAPAPFKAAAPRDRPGATRTTRGRPRAAPP